MKEKTICVFCGREEEQGILSGGHFVSCGGTYQPACKECEKKLELFGDLTIGVMGFLRPGQAIISDCGAKAKVAFIEKYKLGKVVGKRKINYGSYYVAEFNLARLAQLDPEGTERYLLENGLDQKELKAD